MAGERTYPILPCKDLDDSIVFYESIGFKRTYRQLKPNPYGVVVLEDIQIHLAGIEGFDPQNSYGSVIITVPDPDQLYETFSSKLREVYGKLPIKGIPRMTRPRKKYGTISGFSVVDPGGNWLRIYKLGDSDEEASKKATGLNHFINLAARLGDAHGDEALALKTLVNGLKKFPDSAPPELAKAYLYQTELAIRIRNATLAESSFSQANNLSLTEDEKAELSEEFEHIAILLEENK